MTSVFNPDLLLGRAALVTGGGSGIGEGIAVRLAEQGADVALLGRTRDKLDRVASRVRATGRKALVCPADVREYDQVEAALKSTVEAFGKLDLLVNSAAGNFLTPAAALSANGFRAVIGIDLCGTFNVSRAAFAPLKDARGNIVNITATQATVATPLQCHAGAAKAGIEKLTRDLALEWARFGVRVNAVAPGPIEGTEGMKRLAPPSMLDTKSGAPDPMRARVPLGRFGTIDEVCDAVLFLASPAGAYVTGATLLIDGGTSLVGAGPFMEMMMSGG